MKKTIIAVSLAIVAAACGGEEAEEPEAAPSPVPPSPEATTPSPPEATTPPPEAGVTLEVDEAALGSILVDEEGRTLYVFLSDAGGQSTCYDECAGNWPPLEADGEPQAGAGVDDSLLGTTERDDGAIQVTYDRMPLYYFAGDQAPGDTNGQGIGDVWYVVSPEGEPVRS